MKDGKFLNSLAAVICPRSVLVYGVCYLCRNAMISFYPTGKTIIMYINYWNKTTNVETAVTNLKGPATVGSKTDVPVSLISDKSCHAPIATKHIADYQ
jgi:hypothetical protein